MSDIVEAKTYSLSPQDYEAGLGVLVELGNKYKISEGDFRALLAAADICSNFGRQESGSNEELSPQSPYNPNLNPGLFPADYSPRDW